MGFVFGGVFGLSGWGFFGAVCLGFFRKNIVYKNQQTMLHRTHCTDINTNFFTKPLS